MEMRKISSPPHNKKEKKVSNLKKKLIYNMPMIQNKAKCKSSLFYGGCDDSSTYNGFNRSELSSLLVVDVVLLTFSNIDYCPKPLKGFYK